MRIVREARRLESQTRRIAVAVADSRVLMPTGILFLRTTYPDATATLLVFELALAAVAVGLL